MLCTPLLHLTWTFINSASVCLLTWASHIQISGVGSHSLDGFKAPSASLWLQGKSTEHSALSAKPLVTKPPSSFGLFSPSGLLEALEAADQSSHSYAFWHADFFAWNALLLCPHRKLPHTFTVPVTFSVTSQAKPGTRSCASGIDTCSVTASTLSLTANYWGLWEHRLGRVTFCDLYKDPVQLLY